ncbi:MAG: DsbA family protein [Candidatus Saccharibacteria bacterium]
MDKIKWIIFAAVAIAGLGLLVVFSNGNKLNVSSVDINKINTVSDNIDSAKNGGIADQIYGKIDSKITLLEYGDFQCPPCAQASPIAKNISEIYKDKIRFVFRNFPITSAHANAKTAAAVAEAAGLQGKYWEMHDKIYEGQTKWSNLGINERADFFTNYAKDLGLDVTKFTADIASKSVGDKISYDYAVGQKTGVEGTPTFYLNGKKIDQSVFGDPTKLSESIEAEIAKNQ